MLVAALALLLSATQQTARAQTLAADLAAQYGLATSTQFPFPTATSSSADAQELIVNDWSLGKGRIQEGGNNMDFVADPFPNSSIFSGNNNTSPVLRVTYPQGSFNRQTGGAQFYNLWNSTDGSPFQSMMLSYEVAFDEDFDFVKGGKLPGLRGGLDSNGCAGGSESDGEHCWSARLMWRRFGNGEVYAYIPKPNGLCNARDIRCDDDFGISVQRSKFTWIKGTWNRVTLLVQMNDPVDIANGNIRMYYNDLLAISQENLQLRSASSLNANGLFFSSFFGGNDDSWATPIDTHAYFRNIQMWGSGNPSTLEGEHVQGASQRTAVPLVIVSLAAMLSGALLW